MNSEANVFRTGVSRPIRLFRNDFLEATTRTNIFVAAIFWTSVSVALILYGVIAQGASSLTATAAILTGVVILMNFVYLYHRYLSHVERYLPSAKRLAFMMHGAHHADPMDTGRMVLSFPVSVPACCIFGYLFHVMFGGAFATVCLGGLGLGYVLYEMAHSACHRLPLRNGYLRYMKAHHLTHHFIDPTRNFAVPLPWMDNLYGTKRNNGPR